MKKLLVLALLVVMSLTLVTDSFSIANLAKSCSGGSCSTRKKRRLRTQKIRTGCTTCR
jgi:hypothetical protein